MTGISLAAAAAHRRSLPGGVVGPGESPAAAAVRESAEETGLAVRPAVADAVAGARGVFREISRSDP